MEPNRELVREVRSTRTFALAETCANLTAYLTSAIVGLQLDNLTLLAASAHPLATIGFRGLPWKQQSIALMVFSEDRVRRFWFCVVLLVCGSLPFIGYFLTNGAHNFFRTRGDYGALLWVSALGVLLAASVSLLRTTVERESSYRTDALLAFGSGFICLVSAVAVTRTSIWMQDGVSAILVIGAWEARILLWVLTRLFNR